MLENELHRKLTFTWSRPDDIDNPQRTSHVAIELADQNWPGGPWTAVTLEHTDFQADAEMRGGVSGGWPMVFSALKTPARGRTSREHGDARRRVNAHRASIRFRRRAARSA